MPCATPCPASAWAASPPNDQNIAYFDSVPIEMILSVGSIIAAISFTNHYYAFRQRSLNAYRRDSEVRVTITTLIASIIACALYLWHKDFYPDWSHALRFVGFNFISIGLANGYANTDFAAWPLPVSPLDVFPRQHPLQRRQCRRRAQNHPRHRLV